MSLSEEINGWEIKNFIKKDWLFADDVKEAVKELKDFTDKRAKFFIEMQKGRMAGKTRPKYEEVITELSNVLFKLDEIFGEKLK